MAEIWEESFDPDELKDYVRDWTNEMDATSDTIASATITIPASATVHTLAVQAGPTVFGSSKKVKVWFEATTPATLIAAINDGKFDDCRVAVDHSITTAGGRTLNETIYLKLENK